MNGLMAKSADVFTLCLSQCLYTLSVVEFNVEPAERLEEVPHTTEPNFEGCETILYTPTSPSFKDSCRIVKVGRDTSVKVLSDSRTKVSSHDNCEGVEAGETPQLKSSRTHLLKSLPALTVKVGKTFVPKFFRTIILKSSPH